jgi:hypothetical protein
MPKKQPNLAGWLSITSAAVTIPLAGLLVFLSAKGRELQRASKQFDPSFIWVTKVQNFAAIAEGRFNSRSTQELTT